MEIRFRKCEYDDLEFILKLKELGMKWYYEKTYGWDINFQRERTKREIEKFIDTLKIIIVDDKDIGVLNFFEDNNELVIGLIIINPDYQRKKIATTIINDCINTAKKENKTIRISTYKYNPAKILYERLGFKQYSEDDTHVYLHIKFNKKNIEKRKIYEI